MLHRRVVRVRNNELEKQNNNNKNVDPGGCPFCNTNRQTQTLFYFAAWSLQEAIRHRCCGLPRYIR